MNSYCINTIGSYTCTCIDGYRRAESSCIGMWTLNVTINVLLIYSLMKTLMNAWREQTTVTLRKELCVRTKMVPILVFVSKVTEETCRKIVLVRTMGMIGAIYKVHLFHYHLERFY